LVAARLKTGIGLCEQGIPSYIIRSATIKTREEGDRLLARLICY
jgi:hypothetical protein